MKRVTLCMALLAIAGTAAFAGGAKEQEKAAPAAAAARSYEFKLGHLAPTNDPRHIA